VSFTPPVSLPPMKQPPVPIRYDGHQNRSGRCGKQKNLALPGIESGSSNPYPVTIPTELSRFILNYIVP
jgi:hypothetical protein